MTSNLKEWRLHWMENLPDPYRGCERGTWAEYSIINRLPEIGERLIKENQFDVSTSMKILKFIEEIPDVHLKYLVGDSAPDLDAWNHLISHHTGQTWLDAPWFFVEFYFYRRILQEINYFDVEKNQSNDPFLYQKMRGLSQSSKMLAKIVKLDIQATQKGISLPARLEKILQLSLHGNQVDLSLWPADGEVQDDGSRFQTNRESLLVDDSQPIINWLSSCPPQRIDILIDNAGFELLVDLFLVDFLIRENLVREVVLHLKPHPLFVSDAMRKDVEKALEWLAGDGGGKKDLSSLSFRLRKWIEAGSLVLKEHPYWGLPLPLWDLPEALHAEFAKSDLVISKGDANYRRIVGDRKWDQTIPFEQVVGYSPSPILALRMIKSEAGAGYPKEGFEQMKKHDPNWMKNGQWGCIQFWDGRR